MGGFHSLHVLVQVMGVFCSARRGRAWGGGGGGREGGKARRGNVDSSRGAELSTMTGHSKLVLSVAFSADGQWVMSGSSDKTIRLWDTHAAAQ